MRLHPDPVHDPVHDAGRDLVRDARASAGGTAPVARRGLGRHHRGHGAHRGTRQAGDRPRDGHAPRRGLRLPLVVGLDATARVPSVGGRLELMTEKIAAGPDAEQGVGTAYLKGT